MEMRQRVVRGDVDDVGGADAHDGELAEKARRALKRVDVYPKMHREFKVQTEFGATVTIVMVVVMIVLYLSELRAYLHVHEHEHMVVDTTILDKLQINLDISFLAINCKDAHINAMDVAGELQVNMHQNMVKTRLSPDGVPIGRPINMLQPQDVDPTTPLQFPQGYCGSCYDAAHPAGKKCCNTCDEVKEAFVNNGIPLEEAEKKEQCVRETMDAEAQAQEGEGCRFQGKMMVNRVAGNFHVALGRTFHRQGRLMHQFRPGQELTFNASHIVHRLAFGIPTEKEISPLDGMKKIATNPGGVFQYFLKVVPTIYMDEPSPDPHYRISFTQQERYIDPFGQLTALPGAFFVYDLSPFMVKVENDRVPFTHFLTKICAIIGGVMSIAGFVDSFMYNSLHVKKIPAPSIGSSKGGAKLG